MLRAYRWMLSDRHEVTTALGGKAAIELLGTTGGGFDAVLCDLMMPDIDGIDLHRYVSKRFPGLQRRVVFMTGGAFTPRARQFFAQVENPRLVIAPSNCTKHLAAT